MAKIIVFNSELCRTSITGFQNDSIIEEIYTARYNRRTGFLRKRAR